MLLWISVTEGITTVSEVVKIYNLYFRADLNLVCLAMMRSVS